MNPYTDALTAINDAVLPPTILRLATRLLSLVHEDNGYISVSWPEMMTICGVRNRGSVWKYLGALKAANIIHYSTNERVDVSFEAWRTRRNERVDAPKPARGRANSDTADHEARAETGASTRQFEHDEDATCRNWRVHALKLARGRASLDTPIGWLVGIDPTTPSDESLDQPNQKPVSAADEDEQARNLALLTDPEVGLGQQQAERLAAQHRFDWLLRQVFAWREDMASGRVTTPGALVSRLDRAFAPGDLTERDRASPLYQRHVSQEAQRAATAERYTTGEFADLINT